MLRWKLLFPQVVYRLLGGLFSLLISSYEMPHRRLDRGELLSLFLCPAGLPLLSSPLLPCPVLSERRDDVVKRAVVRNHFHSRLPLSRSFHFHGLFLWGFSLTDQRRASHTHERKYSDGRLQITRLGADGRNVPPSS